MKRKLKELLSGISFTPLESSAIYGGDKIDKASISYRKNAAEAPSFLTGFTCPNYNGELEVRNVVCDSKKVMAGDIFIAVKGTNADGHRYIREALERGAGCVVCEEDFQYSGPAVKVVVNDSKSAMAEIAKNFYGAPSRKIKVIGITGTNGKTTTSYLLEKILACAGSSSGIIGTISYKLGGRVIPATNTTPGVLDLQSLLHQMVQSGLEYAIMEVSSHSLDQNRIAGIEFEAAAFTNLTHDHLDYHKEIERYFMAKAKLFELLPQDKPAVINADDPYGRRLIEKRAGPVISYGMDGEFDVTTSALRLDPKGMRFILEARGRSAEARTPLIGRHNLYNVMAAAGLALACNADFDALIRGIEGFEAPPGRLQRIERGQPFEVFVDYAHTDDAIKNVLLALRELSRGRILILFGCGGERDRQKRPKMGKTATELSDYAIITSDNPRGESPQDIIKEIESGIAKPNYTKIVDRQEAIYALMKLAREGDVLLLAGKGHETYQIFKDRTAFFDDAVVAARALESLGYGGVRC